MAINLFKPITGNVNGNVTATVSLDPETIVLLAAFVGVLLTLYIKRKSFQ